jgi:hypothetical protein
VGSECEEDELLSWALDVHRTRAVPTTPNKRGQEMEPAAGIQSRRRPFISVQDHPLDHRGKRQLTIPYCYDVP